MKEVAVRKRKLTISVEDLISSESETLTYRGCVVCMTGTSRDSSFRDFRALSLLEAQEFPPPSFPFFPTSFLFVTQDIARAKNCYRVKVAGKP